MPDESRLPDHRHHSDALGAVDYADAVARRTPPVPLETPAPPRSWRDRSLVQLWLTRLREFIREPEAVFWSFGFPLLLAGGLGIAFRNRPPERVPIAVAVAEAPGDEVAAAIARAETVKLEGALAGDSALAVRVLDDSVASRLLRTGEIALVVVPADDGEVGYRLDPTRDDARVARLLADAQVQRAAGRADPVRTSVAAIREPGSRYIDFFIPGLLGMNLMGSGIWGIGFAIVTARNKKLLKRLVATPMSRVEYLLSFILSRLLFLVVEAAAILGFGILVFGVPARGPLPVLVTVCLAGAFAFAGLGLLIASRPKTIEGVSGLMNLAMLPMWIFSGVFFSSANFPRVIQPFVQALPLTALNDALRLTMLQGAGWGPVLPELGIIVAWMIGSVAIALAVFRWR